MASSYRLSEEELKYLGLATLVVGAGLSAFKQVSSPETAVIWILIAGFAVITREFGQRTVAQWIDAYVDMELSPDGSAVTLMAAMASYLTQLPIVALFPLTNSFSGKKYEHWGKSIDAIWMKRQFWIVFGGLIALFLGWGLAYSAGSMRLAEGMILFLLFQMMPFDHDNVPTGCLDGAYVLRWSGLYWLMMTGTAVIGLVITL